MIINRLSATIKTDFAHTAIEPFFTGSSASISRDRDVLATAFGEEVVITDFQTGRRIQKIKGDTELVTTLAISPDGQYLVVCSRSFTIRIYSLPDCELLTSFKGHDSPVTVMDIDKTSTLVATGAADGSVKVWDLQGGYNTHSFRGHEGVVSAIKIYGLQGETRWQVASGADDTHVRVWDLVKRKCVAVFNEGHVSVVRGLDFNKDGSILISGGRDKVVNVWNLKKYGLIKTILVFDELEVAGFLSGASLSKNSDDIIYTGGEKGVLQLWSLESGQEISSLDRHLKTSEDVSVSQVLYFPSWDDTVITILSDQTLLEQSVSSSNLPIIRRLSGNNGEIIDLAYVGPQNELGISKYLALATNSPDIRVLEIESQSTTILEGHTDIVICIDASIDGLWLASGGKDNVARLWRWTSSNNNSGSFNLWATFKGHAESIGGIGLARSVTSTSYPRFLITGSQDLTVKKWSLPTPTSEVLEISRATFTKKAHDKDINAIDVAPNDEFFASASQDRTIKVYSTEDGETVGILRGHKRGVWSVKFSIYDKLLVSGSGDKTVKVWNLRDYTCVKTFEGHTNSVLKVSFLSLGNQIASAGGDGLVKVWDIKSAECNATLDNHEDKVWSLTTRRDDRVIVSGGGDSVITFWEDVTEEVQEQRALEREELIEKEQELSNHIVRHEWKNAILLAMSLDHPHRLLSLFVTVMAENHEEGSVVGLKEVDAVLSSLTKDQLQVLFKRIRDWNTNARTSPVAQRLLHTILLAYPPETILEIEDIRRTLGALLPYSERHYNRVNELLEDSFIVDFTLRQMDEILVAKMEDL
ncbi:WD40-repeat-containing domain protein [Dipodascopsis uninucleata]